MAGSSVIGALRVVLGADSGTLEKDLKGAWKTIDGFAAKTQIALGAAFGAAAGALAGLGVAVRKQINDFDDLSKASQKIGVPVEDLIALRYAADLSDVSTESLDKSLGKLARTVVDAAQGSTTAVAAYQALGVSFREADGSLRSVGDLLPELADRFAAMEDGTAKTGLAMQIFGRTGADLIPLLNGGAAGLREATNEARALGLVIDGQTGRSAEAFNDNLTRLGRVFTGVVTQITARMLPALQQFSQVAIDAAKNTDLLNQVADGIVAAFRFVVAEAIKATVSFERAAAELQALWAVLMAPNWETMKNAWAAFRAEGEKTVQTFATVDQTIKKFYDTAAAGAASTSKAIQSTFTPEIVTTTKDALESFLISQQKHIVATEVQAATVGKSNAEQAAMRVTQEALAIATANNIVVTEAYRLKIDALAQSAANAAMMLQGAQLTQQVQTPAEQYAEKLALQTQLFEAGAISAETYARAQKKAADDAGTSWDIAGASIAGSFKTISGSFAKESGAMATVAKVAGAIQATISMFTGAAKALELPFPANLAAMASVLATGASLVASIKGTAVPKFATGGSMLVGGSGGIDSQRVAMDVSPGEVIQVHQNKYGESIGGAGRTLSIQGVEPDKWFSGRQIIEMINEAMRDGSKLELKPAF